MARLVGAGLLAGLLALLPGCAQEPPTICPVLGVLDSAATLTRLQPGAASGDADVAYVAEITDADLSCVLKGDLLYHMEVNLKIAITGRKGPAADSERAEVEYFVVITDRSGNVVTKKTFPATIEFDGRPQATVVEEIWQLYELEQGGAGSLYEIWVGFQLTDEELEFNRKQRAGAAEATPGS